VSRPTHALQRHGLPTPIVTAEIGGAITNRVTRIRRLRRRPESAPKRYQADKSVIGEGAKVFAVSAPEAFVVAMDRAAEERRMSRSHLIRFAVERLLEQEGRSR
jgi:hypothetical protein